MAILRARRRGRTTDVDVTAATALGKTLSRVASSSPIHTMLFLQQLGATTTEICFLSDDKAAGILALERVIPNLQCLEAQVRDRVLQQGIHEIFSELGLLTAEGLKQAITARSTATAETMASTFILLLNRGSFAVDAELTQVSLPRDVLLR